MVGEKGEGWRRGLGGGGSTSREIKGKEFSVCFAIWLSFFLLLSFFPSFWEGGAADALFSSDFSPAGFFNDGMRKELELAGWSGGYKAELMRDDGVCTSGRFFLRGCGFFLSFFLSFFLPGWLLHVMRSSGWVGGYKLVGRGGWVGR